MDLEFVERCKENSEFRIQRDHRDLFAINVAHEIWVSDWSPAEGVPDETLLATGMERKRKGGSSDLPASFFAIS